MKLRTLLPGVGLSFAVALVAITIAELIPVDFISATVLAIFLGVIVNNLITIPEQATPGIQFSAKRLLKGFIILLGASMNLSLIVEIGAQSLILLMFTITTAFMSSYVIGRFLNTEKRLTTLFAVGGAICGGSAITAVSPVINAKEREIAYSVSTVFLIDMFLILLIPLLSQLFNFTDLIVGLWSGTAINDTSSVVAASFSFSQGAGEFATMVKMTRTLAIIPIVIIFSVLNNKGMDSKKVKSIFPWFIVGFAGFAVINTLGWIPEVLGNILSTLRTYLMVTALAAIGLKTDISSIKILGFKPFIHSMLVSAVVILISITVIQFIL